MCCERIGDFTVNGPALIRRSMRTDLPLEAASCGHERNCTLFSVPDVAAGVFRMVSKHEARQISSRSRLKRHTVSTSSDLWGLPWAAPLLFGSLLGWWAGIWARARPLASSSAVPLAVAATRRADARAARSSMSRSFLRSTSFSLRLREISSCSTEYPLSTSSQISATAVLASTSMMEASCVWKAATGDMFSIPSCVCWNATIQITEACPNGNARARSV